MLVLAAVYIVLGLELGFYSIEDVLSRFGDSS
jgi:hypothetical protein